LVFGIGLAFKIFLARTLTVEDNGYFGKWLATYNYGIIALSFGLNLSLIYFVETKRLSKEDGLSLNLLFYLLLLPILIGFSFLDDDVLFFVSLSFATVIGLLISTLNSVQLIVKRISRFNLTELTRSILVFVLVLIYIDATENYNLNGLYFGYGFGLLLTFLLFFSLEGGLKIFNWQSIRKIDFSYFKYGSKGLVLNVLGQGLYIADIYIVEYLAGPRSLGLYVVAGSVARLLWFFVDAAGTIIFPKLIQGQGSSGSKDIIYRLSTISFFINLLGILIFVLSANFSSEFHLETTMYQHTTLF
jgi:O-antigen/teichoic acid export membrane protein